MHLVPLCSVEWTYDFLTSVAPSSEGDGRAYGQGSGVVSGRIEGIATWANNPRLRGDHAYPDARGVIRLSNGGEVIFALSGLSSLTDGRGVHVMTFQTDAPAQAWLNTVLAVAEGSIDVEHSTLSMRYYECVVELPG